MNTLAKQRGSFISHDGEKIVYFMCGQSDCPAVLLLHGFRNSSQSWFDAGKRFSSGLAFELARAGYFVVAPDLRGHGKSAKPQDTSKYTNEQELYDIVELANHLQLSKYAVVGYSHGSIEAAKLLTIDSGRITCGVLGGIGDAFTDEQWKQQYGVTTIAVSFEARARGEDVTAAVRAAGGNKPLPESAFTGLEARRDGVQCMLALAGVQRGQSVTTPQELATIKVPVLCISGVDDHDNGDVGRLNTLIPSSELKLVDGDHGTATMHPSFCETIVSFVSRSLANSIQPHTGAVKDGPLASGYQSAERPCPSDVAAREHPVQESGVAFRKKRWGTK